MSWFAKQKVSHSTKISLVAKISPFKFPFCQKSPFFQKISLVSKISLWQKFPNFSKNLPFIIFFINIPYCTTVQLKYCWKHPSSYLILFVHNFNKPLALMDWNSFQSCFLKKFIFATQFQKRFWSFEQSVGLLRVQNMKWMKFYFGKVL